MIIQRNGSGAFRLRELKPGEYAKSLKPTKLCWAILCCPQCGKLSTVGKNHTVSADGAVTPSYVCPFKPCTWHTGIMLGDWGNP